MKQGGGATIANLAVVVAIIGKHWGRVLSFGQRFLASSHVLGQSIVADQPLVKAGDAYADNCIVQSADQAAQFGQLKFHLSK